MALRLLRLPTVMERLGIGVTTVYAAVNSGLLTPPVKLSARSSAWPEHEIDAVVAAKIAGKSDEEIRALMRELIDERPKIMSRVGAHAAA